MEPTFEKHHFFQADTEHGRVGWNTDNWATRFRGRCELDVTALCGYLSNALPTAVITASRNA
jgi:hypothetical protein